ncbi:hypothetical protein [Rhizobium sp. NFR12]|uniref:hypothetical protein n=1 Tax=Rhizobium sp. NFR12 TaxID=1566261 RepID=UPI000B825C8C|nr:hypothetical protein [Rhizobium sp. NFR12]
MLKFGLRLSPNRSGRGGIGAIVVPSTLSRIRRGNASMARAFPAWGLWVVFWLVLALGCTMAVAVARSPA